MALLSGLMILGALVVCVPLARMVGELAREAFRAGKRPPKPRSSASVNAAAASMKYTVPRSNRRTPSRPHTCAMSVALLDQGDTVPTRGATVSRRPRSTCKWARGP